MSPRMCPVTPASFTNGPSSTHRWVLEPALWYLSVLARGDGLQRQVQLGHVRCPLHPHLRPGQCGQIADRHRRLAANLPGRGHEREPLPGDDADVLQRQYRRRHLLRCPASYGLDVGYARVAGEGVQVAHADVERLPHPGGLAGDRAAGEEVQEAEDGVVGDPLTTRLPKMRNRLQTLGAG